MVRSTDKKDVKHFLDNRREIEKSVERLEEELERLKERRVVAIEDIIKLVKRGAKAFDQADRRSHLSRLNNEMEEEIERVESVEIEFLYSHNPRLQQIAQALRSYRMALKNIHLRIFNPPIATIKTADEALRKLEDAEKGPLVLLERALEEEEGKVEETKREFAA